MVTQDSPRRSTATVMQVILSDVTVYSFFFSPVLLLPSQNITESESFTFIQIIILQSVKFDLF